MQLATWGANPRRLDAGKTILYGSPVLLLLLALLFLLKQCRKPDAGPFDYFQAKASELGNDPGRVARFVAEEVKGLPYTGNVKGALGTLWEGAGSPEEKAALSDALLAHCSGGKSSGATKDPVLTATLTHRGERETVVYEGPIGDLVGDSHSIETVAPGKTRMTIRARAPLVKELEAGTEREELLFRVQRPGGEAPLEVVRELWHKDNQVGPIAAIPGDRHDFVVLPCRIGRYVREKEEQLLRQRGREKSEEASGYLSLLDYCLRSDLAMADLERDLQVRARYDVPRILILSRAKVPGLPGGALALDLRLNRVTFDGARKSDAYLAAQVRSFVESGLEQHVLTKITGQPCSSTYDLFNKLNDDFPNSYDRRLALLRDSVASLGEGGRAAFKDRKGGPTVTVKKEGGRYRVEGAAIKESLVQQLKLPDPPVTPEDAALAVELALMSSGAAPDAVLEVVEISRADDSLVTEGATFVFRWGQGASRTDQTIQVESCDEGLGLKWRVQTGVRPARGRRFLTKRALDGAAVHNPWYATGDDRQDEATSFCVSRAVFERLRSGQAVEMALQGAYRPEDDQNAPRPIAWKGQATRAGEGVHRTRVNGREEELRFIRAKLGGDDVAILDDPRFPIGMADKIVEIRTSIRARLVDETGLGIAGVSVEVAGQIRKTGPDGRFVLAPTSGKVTLIARRGEELLGEREVDLTAPGRSEVRVTVPPEADRAALHHERQRRRAGGAAARRAGTAASRSPRPGRPPDRHSQPEDQDQRRGVDRLLLARRRDGRHHRRHRGGAARIRGGLPPRAGEPRARSGGQRQQPGALRARPHDARRDHRLVGLQQGTGRGPRARGGHQQDAQRDGRLGEEHESAGGTGGNHGRAVRDGEPDAEVRLGRRKLRLLRGLQDRIHRRDGFLDKKLEKS
jgi:hypothetical protein